MGEINLVFKNDFQKINSLRTSNCQNINCLNQATYKIKRKVKFNRLNFQVETRICKNCLKIAQTPLKLSKSLYKYIGTEHLNTFHTWECGICKINTLNNPKVLVWELKRNYYNQQFEYEKFMDIELKDKDLLPFWLCDKCYQKIEEEKNG